MSPKTRFVDPGWDGHDSDPDPEEKCVSGSNRQENSDGSLQYSTTVILCFTKTIFKVKIEKKLIHLFLFY